MYFISKKYIQLIGHKILYVFFILVSVFASASDNRPVNNVSANVNTSGKVAFENNCRACHLNDRLSAGPSLVYIKDNYPKSKRQAFLDWANSPGKNNPDLIQMPPMSHLGSSTLSVIHDYILFVAKHLKEQKAKPQFPSYKAPDKKFPIVKRKYLPFTSPASIAVSLSKEVSIVWDTVTASVRYVYPTYAPFHGEKHLQENRKKVMYQEVAPELFSFQQGKKIDYLGYLLKEGSPEFIYQVGNVRVREKIYLGSDVKSFIREFTLIGLTEAITLDFQHHAKYQGQQQVTIVSNKGKLTGNKLVLSAEQAKKFIVEVNIK